MTITWKGCKTGGKLILITNRKSYMSFRLVLKLVTLNDLEWLSGRYIALFQLLTTCSRIELIDQMSASITHRTMKLVCVTKLTHARVDTKLSVYCFTLQLLTFNLSSEFHFTTMF